MADEQEAIAPAALETASEPEVIETDEPQAIPDPGAEPSEVEAEGESEPEPLELIEIEWDDGKKYQIPKVLESGLLKNKDYTTKTQSVAEKAKALESREAEINRKAEATEAELDARAELRGVNAQLAEFAKLSPQDWQNHADTDPKGTGDAWRYFQMLKDQKADLEGKVGKAQAERTEKAQQDLAKRVQDTLEAAPKFIPGFKPESIKELVEYAHSKGIDEDTIQKYWSPTFAEILHRATIGEKALKAQAAAPKLPATPLTPLSTVGGKSTPANRGDLGSMSMEAYVAARKQGVGGKPLR